MAIEYGGVFDIETRNWTEFVVGATLDAAKLLTVCRDERSMFVSLMSMKGDVFAHYGGKFDFLWVVEQCEKAGVAFRAYMSGERVIRLDLEDGPRLRDSYSLLPMALNNPKSAMACTDLIGVGRYDLELPCICRERCAGYCRIGEPQFRAAVEEYLALDVRTLDAVLRATFARFARDGIEARGTAGSTAWATLRAVGGVEPVQWEEPAHFKLVRSAYYGGRTELYRTHSDRDGYRYDLNAAYPAALVETALPVGDYRRVDAEVAARCWERGKPGIYGVTVQVMEQFAPPLPWRTHDRLYFPTGVIAGQWARPELERALSASRAHVVRWHSATVWGEEAKICAPTAAKLWALRSSAVGNGERAWGTVYKAIANAMTGKLGQGPEAIDVVAFPRPESVRWCKCERVPCGGRCLAWEPLRRDLSVWKAPRWAIPASGYAHWAAYLTASVRVKLHRAIVGGDPWHCHTDSLYAGDPRPDLEVGDWIGQWGFEGRASSWQAMAPGVYSYTDEHGRRHTRARGIPRVSASDWDRLLAGERLKRRGGAMSLLKSMHRGGKTFCVGEGHYGYDRSKQTIVGGRIVGGGGSTRPMTAAEIRELHATGQMPKEMTR